MSKAPARTIVSALRGTPAHPFTRVAASALLTAVVGVLSAVAAGQQVGEDPDQEQRYRRAAELAGQALADLENGSCGAAEQRLLEVERILPRNLLPKINLAICYAYTDQRQRALAKLREARELAPDNPRALFATARILEGEVAVDEQARRLWDQSLERLSEVTRGDPRPGYLRALVHLRSDRPGDALTHLASALEHSPENLALLLADLEAAAAAGDLDRLGDALNAVEDRLNGFDPRSQRFADQLRDALWDEDPDAARPPATILLNLLRPTELYRVGLTELVGRGDGSQMFPQLEFEPPLPPSIQGGQDIEIAWRARPAWTNGLAAESPTFVGRGGETDRVLLFGSEGLALLTGSSPSPTVQHLAAIDAFDDEGPTTAAAHVDIDQDANPDLLILRPGGLFWRRSSGTSDFDAEEKLWTPTPGSARSSGLAVADFDQEGDLDVLILRIDAEPVYLQNRGTGGLVPVEVPFTGTVAHDSVAVDLDGDGDLDVVHVGDAGVVTWDNLRGGSYRRARAWSVDAAPGRRLATADFDNDGHFDLLVWGGDSPRLLRNTGSGFESRELPSSALWTSATVADLDNDGDEDIAAAWGDGLAMLRNRRGGEFRVEPIPETPGGLEALQAADLDADGDLDLLAVAADQLVALSNQGGDTNHWLRVRLQGRYDNNSKNNLLGHSSLVEIRSGGAYQARLADGTPLHFGLGSNRRAEVLRVVWTNGLAQTQQQVSSRQTLVEEQVLKGSCPFLYTWNGERFEFHTDLLWRSTLGMTFADGSPAPHQSGRDWILIPGDRLAPVGGRYWLSTTAELWESIYLDRQQLLVVDHPQEIELVVDESFRPPPHPEDPPIHWVADRRVPARAADHRGRDVLEALARRDGARVDDLPLTRHQGVTDEHWIDLEFTRLPSSGQRKLLLSGWIFPTDTTINVALSQDPGLATAPPRLELLRAGRWQTVIPSLGLPMGKSKTMVVDLGKVLTDDELASPTLRLRVATTMQIYWNRASLAVAGDTPEDARVVRLDPAFADLHYRGFSALLDRAPGEPHRFDYQRVDTTPRFRDLAGLYTAYGDVRDLVLASESNSVIMNAGDELTVSFPSEQLLPLPEGHTRNFVLHTDGWVKDGDVHTRSSQTVTPLPSHGMSGYPDDSAVPTSPDRRTREVDQSAFRDAVRRVPLTASGASSPHLP